MKIMMTGGGTLGPVTPLLAVVESWRREDSNVDVVWVGTTNGPEKSVVEKNGIQFFALTAPKFDRHAPLRWLLIPFRLAWSMKVAVDLIRRERPDVVVTAGGYVSVPVLWTARLYGIPTWVHQQDVRAGLANQLMVPAATKISVAWTRTMHKFPKSKTIHLGNPVRPSIADGSKEKAAARFRLDLSKPTVLVLGGGTGAVWINETVASIAPELSPRAHILHITGRGKAAPVIDNPSYRHIDLITDGMADVYALADLVVCRAGMGTISELSLLSKPAIIIPMPNSHQEDNTSAVEELEAAMIVHQSQTSPQMLLQTISEMLDDPEECRKLGARLHTALPTVGVAEKLAKEIRSIVKQKTST